MRWTPEFRAWLKAYVAEGDTELVRELDHRAALAADRERALLGLELVDSVGRRAQSEISAVDVLAIAQQLHDERARPRTIRPS